MPDYWDSLVHIDSMTVELTPIGANQDIYVDSIADNEVAQISHPGNCRICGHASAESF